MDWSMVNGPVWAWLAAAAALLAVEVATGSGYLLWASASAGLVAALAALGIRLGGGGGQAVVFAVLAITSTYAARRLWPRRAPGAGDSLNDADARLIGREGRAVTAFADAHGRVFVEGKEWAADAETPAPLQPGARVRVLGVVGGSRLRVMAIESHA